MSTIEAMYTAALRVGSGLLPLLGRGESKLARGIRGRRDTLERFERWAAGERNSARPLIWFHAPSVGEGFQARAVMEELRARDPRLQIAYTYFSPSAESFAATAPADVTGYLPLDLPAEIARMFEALRPAVVVFSKTEVWPNVTREAERRDVPALLLSATLPEDSSRLRGGAKRLLAPAHRRLHRVGAISDADARRFAELGVSAGRIAVSGDARFDQVARRAAATDPGSDLLRPLADPRLTLVAGSTWPEDEAPLVDALASIARAGTAFRAVLVPHEPTGAHLTLLEQRLTDRGLSHARLSHLEEGRASAGVAVVVVDRVGVLGELYALASVAYVGGGFGTRGLHSVLEPAAFGAPVLFGPHHANAREAGELIGCGGGAAVADATGLEDRLRRLLLDRTARDAAGAAAMAYIAAGRGAAQRGAEMVLEAMANDR